MFKQGVVTVLTLNKPDGHGWLEEFVDVFRHEFGRGQVCHNPSAELRDVLMISGEWSLDDVQRLLHVRGFYSHRVTNIEDPTLPFKPKF